MPFSHCIAKHLSKHEQNVPVLKPHPWITGLRECRDVRIAQCFPTDPEYLRVVARISDTERHEKCELQMRLDQVIQLGLVPCKSQDFQVSQIYCIFQNN